MKASLILLPGALGSSSQFDALENLLKNHFKIIKPDFSGHGKNEGHSGNLSIELFAEEILAMLPKHEEVHIFGYSMGGYVALYLALKYPQKVKKIITLATKFNWNKSIAEAETKLLNPEKIKEKVPSYAAHLQKLHGLKWETLMMQTTKIMLQLGNNNLLSKAELAKIKNTVLLTVGDKDTMVTLEETQAAHASIPNSKCHTFIDTPHPWEQVNQKLIAEAIIEFI